MMQLRISLTSTFLRLKSGVFTVESRSRIPFSPAASASVIVFQWHPEAPVEQLILIVSEPEFPYEKQVFRSISALIFLRIF
jgi:hypothetical protein